MTPEEMKLDMLVAELDYENRLLRARNERLEREAEARKPLTDDQIDDIWNFYCDEQGDVASYASTDVVRAIEAAHGIKGDK